MWKFENPVKICFGTGVFKSVGEIVNGRTYCLVTYDEPYFCTLTASLADQLGQPQVLINNIRPNPDFADLRNSCQQFADAISDDTVIIALGGGSVIDTAKVLAFSNTGFEPVRQFLETGERQSDVRSYPIIAIPTTAGTGSELTHWATVWNTELQKKYSLAHHSLYPEYAIVDPELTLGIPKDLTVSTALDALSHSLESLWNHNTNPVSANHAVFAASEIIATLPLLINDLENIGLRARVTRASLLSGLAFSNTKTALAHSVSYPITLKYGVPHGVACSFSLPKILASVIGEDKECDQNLRRIFGHNLHSAVIHLENFLNDLGVSTKVASYGIQQKEWKQLLTSALTGVRGRNFIGKPERVLAEFIF